MRLKRTDKDDPDFITLVHELNTYLEIADGADHEFYHQFNGIDNLEAVIVGYDQTIAVACGAFRIKKMGQVEIKRMYTLPSHRQQGWAGKILYALEDWARELKNHKSVLETGVNQSEAIRLYPKLGYKRIPNFEPYVGVITSYCFGKTP